MESLRRIKELAARIEGRVPLLIGAIIVLNHQQYHSGPFLAMLACIALLVLIGKASNDRPDHERQHKQRLEQLEGGER